MILGISLGAAFLATITASLTWFDNRVNLSPSINGGSAAAYFAYGRGTKDEPYGITNPRHLYNLAWLQYLGKFDSTTIYFELAADINMDDEKHSTIKALPPIGNSEHPFIGQFTSKTDDNGKYHTISNLKISNSYNDFGITPYSVTNTSYTSDNIVGMFGVVGDPTKKTNPDTKIDNFYLESPTITSTNSQALAGIVAGYVNAEISSVGVITPTMSFPTTDQATSPLQQVTFKNETTKEFKNVSDYSVVGYCEDAYKSSISSSVTKLKNSISYNTVSKPNDHGGSQKGWGGSVDMQKMYDGLLTQVYNNVKSNDQGAITYTASTEIDNNGTIKTTPAKNSLFAWENNTSDPNLNYNYPNFRYPNTNPSTYDSFSFYEDKAVNTEGKQTASYSIISKTKTTTGSIIDDSAYLSFTGYAKRSIIDGNTIKNSNGTGINKKKATRFYEDGASIQYYFSVVNTSSGITPSVTQDSSLSTPIIMENLSQSNSKEGPYLISFYYGGTEYYFSTRFDANNEVASLIFSTETPADDNGKWKFNSLASAFSPLSYPDWYFALDTNFENWGLQKVGSTYTIKDENKNQFYVVKKTTKSDYSFTNEIQDGWTNFPIFMNNGYIYINENTEGSGNAIRYIKITDSQIDIGNSGTNKTGCFTYTEDANGTKIYVEKSTYYYPYFDSNSNSWITKTSKTIADVPYFTVTKTPDASFPFHYGGPNQEIPTSFTVDSPFTTPDTYFPLQGTDENIGIPKSNNTGYVVGGTDYYDDFSGDIRISKYENSNLSVSYSGNQLNTILSIDTKGKFKKSTESADYFDSFVKYNSSKQQLTDILNKDSNIYGIHFMNGTIGKRSDNTYVKIPSATINGIDYSDYEVPDDCIDFKLDEEGYINFFAGTYFPNNNCFFSLYKVERDSDNKITALKKIKAVYSGLGDFAKKAIAGPGTPYYSSDGWQKNEGEPRFKLQCYNENENHELVLETEPTWTICKKDENDKIKKTVKNCIGTLAFDIDTQLGNQGNQFSYGYSSCAFYFEIPVPAGEYALGSVDGGIGAYLMYLDIGTNAKLEVSRTTIIDSMTTTIETTKTFMGVSIVSAATTSASYNSYCIVLKNGINGDIKYERDTTTSSGSVTINSSVYKDSDTLIQVSFKKSDFTVQLSTTSGTTTSTKPATIDSTINPISKKTVTKERVSLYDYYSSSIVTNILEVTRTTTTEGDPTTEYKKTQKDKDWKDTSNTNFNFRDKNNGNDIDTTNEKGITTFFEAYSSELSAVEAQTTPAFSYSMQSEILGNIQIDFTPILTLNKQNQYEISGYSITITPLDSTTQGTIIVSSVTRNNNTYTIKINNVDTGEQETITITVPAPQS